MRRPSPRSIAKSVVLLLATSTSLMCTHALQPPGVPGGGEGAPALEHHVGAADERLVFPPEPGDARRSRPELGREYSSRVAGGFRVLEPSLDSSGAFGFTGASFRVSFSEPVVRPSAKGTQKGPVRAEPGTVTLTPAVAGSAAWLDARTLEFTAERPFAENTAYEVQIGPVTAATGAALPVWKATFEARPSFVVAGKEIGYLPKPGEERVIAMHPADDKVGTSPELSVLFDQPISLTLARTLLTLEAADGNPVPVLLDHPGGPTFQGVKVDPRLVVLVGARAPLGRGKHFTLRAIDHTASARTREYAFVVADALESSGVECGYGWQREELCRFEKGRLRTSGREIHVLFDNPIETRHRALGKAVQISPPARNVSLRAEGWGEPRLILRGDFASSTTYDVTIAGLTDVYGGRLGKPVQFKLETTPLGASVAMGEGLVMLDEERTKRFSLTSRNVSELELRAYAVEAGPKAFATALEQARSHMVPVGEPSVRVEATVRAARDKLVETELDLRQKLAAGTSYLVTVVPQKLAFGAEPVAYPRGSEAHEEPVALLTPADARTLAVHARVVGGATLVHVARLATGEPVAGASVRRGEETDVATTDANGVTVLTGEGAEGAVLEVSAGDVKTLAPLSGKVLRAKDLFPELTGGLSEGDPGRRAMLITDRGIYRPGSIAFIKATVRHPEGDRLVAKPGEKLRIRALGPTGDQAWAEDVSASETGSASVKFEIPSDARVGRHTIVLEDPDDPEPPLARSVVQVAEFEPPRFAVDVEMRDAPGAKGALELDATVRGRYLFGAPMSSSVVSWTLTREEAPFPAGPLSDAGLVFRRRTGWWSEDERAERWSRSGEGTLSEAGALAVQQVVELPRGEGPQAFVLEADVTDSSSRHIAGRGRLVAHPAKHYAGLKLGKGWVGVGEQLPLELGVIDTEGASVVGVPVTAKLERVEWRYATRRGPAGSIREEWTARRAEAGRCAVKSAIAAVGCSIIVPSSGEYELTAEAEGRRGGAAAFYAWHDGDEDASPSPHRGHTVAIAPDKSRYAPGETAHLLVRSPFPAATAILTIEQGGLLEHHEKRVRGSAAVFDVPLTSAHAPYAHATVTLLPIGAKGAAAADLRVGAVRLPVSVDGARLEVAVRSDRPSYEPGQEAELTVEVKDHGKPDPGAEIALAVVDEGVLRLTAFRPVDPVLALRPGRSLAFELFDGRLSLEGAILASHVAGDGGGNEGATLASTRRDFVETALFRPDLRTDAAGRATVKLLLPDNLTEWRMMAVVLDEGGKGAVSEASFTVNKPLMLVPIVPRFAAVGDAFEAAAMVHNATALPFPAIVRLGDRTSSVTVEPGGHARVAFPMKAEAPGAMLLSFALGDASAKVVDRVEAKIPIEEPGIEERPRVDGAFSKSREIALAIPASVRSSGDESISIQVGQHLWPELGARLGYLLDYPHGCVEQTTSSTLPLIAARTILPRIGVTRMSDAQLGTRIRAGLERLVTMRTPGGGLAYWPGGDEPNVYGTAYAIRAVVLAQKGGIPLPKGLLEGMQGYLATSLLGGSTEPEVKAAIAQSLAESSALPPSAVDALYETREAQSVFGLASLALALHALPGQEDRVAELLDRVEASFTSSGDLERAPSPHDFHYYGSPTRSRAQAAIALGRLRRTSRLLPVLLRDLSERVESYTTQSTAYSLLALAEQLGATASGGARVRVLLDGAPLVATKDLGSGAAEYRVPLATLAGKKATLRLESESDEAVGFLLGASYRRPSGEAGSLAASSAAKGPSVYRVYTDARGEPVDLTRIKAGDVVRIALLAHLPSEHFDRERLGYLALTDRLPAGFEPVQPDLATVASAPDLADVHPFAALLRSNYNAPNHVELHDDRVDVYFDRTWGDDVAATYLARATTPGEFAVPPAAAELMYEGDSVGYSDGARVVIR